MARRKPARKADPLARWPGVTIPIDDAGGTYFFDEAAAQRAVNFFPLFLTHHKGEFAGRPFELLPWQAELIVRPLFGWKRRSDGLRRFRKLLLFVPKKQGKGLALDTPLPTPEGWTTIGELQAGDRLIGPNGRPCTVTFVTPERHIDCFEVSFSNGERVIADADHQWLTTAWVNAPGDLQAPRVPSRTRVRTTRELFETQVFGKQRIRNHFLWMPEALELPAANLPVAPYVLGVWLGDGHSQSATISVGTEDLDELTRQLEAEGVSSERSRDPTCWRLVLRATRPGLFDDATRVSKRDADNLQYRLRALGLLGNKHIPAAYLRASREQRLALLQGLMDTDGTVAANGLQLEYGTVSEALRDGVAELLASLGLKFSVTEVQPRCNGVETTNKAYRIRFSAYRDTLPVFRFPRKLARMRLASEVTRQPRSRTVQVASVVPVSSVPTRCLTVDHQSSQFLFGRTMLPTHNTELCAGLANLVLFCDDEPGAEIMVAAADRDQARLLFNEAKAMVEDCPDLAGRADVLRSEIVYRDLRAVMKVISAEARTKHGPNLHCVIVDELHAQPDRDLVETLEKGVAARLQPLILYLTTAGDDLESIAYEEYDYARKLIAGTITDDRCLPVVFEADPTADWRDPETWRQANPSLNVTVREEYFRDEVTKAINEPRKQNAFKRLHLNIWTQQETVWIPIETWDACRVAQAPTANAAKLLAVGGLDLSSKIDLTAFVVALRHEDAPGTPADTLELGPDLSLPEADRAARRLTLSYSVDFVPFFWLPEETLWARVKEDGIPYDLWRDQGFLRTTPGNVVDYDAVLEQLTGAILPQFGVSEIGYDPWNAMQFALQLEAKGFTCTEVGQNFKHLSEPSKLYEALILSRRARHDGHPVLRMCVSNVAIKEDPAGNIRPVKPAKKKRIDGVVASITALSRLMVAAPVKPSRYARGGGLIVRADGLYNALTGERVSE